MSKYKVIELGDDSFPELSKARGTLLEPSQYDSTFYKTVQPAEYRNISFDPTETIKYEEWEKILVHESESTFYIWKHLGTGLLFR